MSALLGTATAVIDLDIDKFMGNARRAEQAMNQLAGAGGAGGKGLGAWAANNERSLLAMGGAATLAGGAIVGGLAAGINVAANFEQGMSGVEAALGGVGTAAGITEAQFQALDKEARRIGTTTSKSATESAASMELLAKAGLSVEDILNGGAQAAVNISEATGEGLQQSSETMAGMLTFYKDTGLTAGRAADIIVTGMNASSATMSEFTTGMARMAPVAALTGMSMEETAASVAYFNAQGLSAAETGTSMQAAFASMVKPLPGAGAAIEELAANTGVTIDAFDDLTGEFIGFPALMDQVAGATAGMNEEQRAAALTAIFGADALDVMGIAAEKGGAGLAALEKDMSASGSAAAASATRMDNFKGSVEKLSGVIQEAMMNIGGVFLPGLRLGVDTAAMLVGAFNGLPGPILAVGAALTGIVGAALLASGAFLLLLPRIMETRTAFQALQTAPGFLGKFSRSISRFGRFARFGALAMGPLALAAGALYVAYKTNFLGIGDITDKTIGGIKKFGSNFAKSFKTLRSTTDVVSASFLALGTAINSIAGGNAPDWVKSIGDAFITAGAALSSFVDLFDLSNEKWAAAAGPMKDFVSGARLVIDSIRDLVDAFQAGGLSGLLDALPGEFDDITRGIGRMGDAIREGIAGKVDELTSEYERLRSRGVSPLNAAVSALATTFPILEQPINIARALLADFSNTARDAAEALGIIPIARVAVSIGRWAIQTAADFGTAVATWVQEHGAATAARLWDVLVDIASWAKGVITDLAPYVATWATEAVGAVTSAAATVWNVLVNIGSWAKGIISDLAPYVAMWATTAASAVVSAAATIWNVLINIGSWAKGIVSDLAPYVAIWASAAASAVVSAAATIWNVLINIGSWAKGLVSDLGPFVSKWADEAWSLTTGAVATLWDVRIDVGSWSIDGPDIKADVQAFVDGAGEISTELEEWRVLLGRPEVEYAGGAGGGGGGGSGLRAEIGRELQEDLRNPFQLAFRTNLTMDDMRIAGNFVGQINDKVQAAVDAAIPDTYDGPSWMLNMPMPFIIGAGAGQALRKWVADEFGGTIEGARISLDLALDVSGLSSFKWPDLPEWTWPEISFTWPTFPQFTWSAYPTWTWPAISFTWPEFPEFSWPEIPMPGWWPGGGEDEAMQPLPPAASTGPGGGGFSRDRFMQGAELGIDFSGMAVAAALELDKVTSLIDEKTAVWGTGMTTALDTMVVNAQTGFAGVATAASTQLTIMGAQAGLAMANLQTGITTAFTTIGMNVSLAMTTLGLAVSTGFTIMAAQAGLAMSNLSIGVTTAFTTLSTNVTTAMNTMKTNVTTGMNEVVTAIQNGMNQASQAATTAANTISNIIGALAGSIAEDGRRAGSEFAGGISDGFAEAVSAAQGAAQDIQGAFSQLPGTMAAIGRAAGAALAGGLQSQVGAVQAAAGALMAAASVGAMAAAMFGSPPKVWVDMGRDLGVGLGIGMDEAHSLVSRAGGSLMAAALPTRSALDTLPTRAAGGGTVNNYYTVITPTPSEYDRIDHQARRGSAAADLVEDIKAERRAQNVRTGTVLH